MYFLNRSIVCITLLAFSQIDSIWGQLVVGFVAGIASHFGVTVTVDDVVDYYLEYFPQLFQNLHLDPMEVPNKTTNYKQGIFPMELGIFDGTTYGLSDMKRNGSFTFTVGDPSKLSGNFIFPELTSDYSYSASTIFGLSDHGTVDMKLKNVSMAFEAEISLSYKNVTSYKMNITEIGNYTITLTSGDTIGWGIAEEFNKIAAVEKTTVTKMAAESFNETIEKHRAEYDLIFSMIVAQSYYDFNDGNQFDKQCGNSLLPLWLCPLGPYELKRKYIDSNLID
ncbi:hypothetical protein QAD02_000621 [Eretmocerus hayati]|uniref:Uncharacterized protein n=1 Tax=Eretmocerus hayati TaxID=131215 RepID=A0ACC2NDX8_9HYME|nr:hypothetical protein QAD02_000621 [Eretmocerus hayati]